MVRGLSQSAGRVFAAAGILLLSGSLTAGGAFIRGDVDGDQSVGAGDAQRLLRQLFSGRPALSCPDAGGVNDDGLLNLADCISLLSYLFAGGPKPRPPFPFCGSDPTPDALPCTAGIECPRGSSAILKAAQPITPGVPTSGEISAPFEQDLYTFVAPPAQRVFLHAQETNNFKGLNWYLQDSWGRTILSSFSDFSDLGPVTLMGGTYTLAILGEDSATGAYKFTLYNAPVVENQIVLGSPVDGAVTSPGEVQAYNFSLTQTATVYIDAEATDNYSKLNWSLVNERGRTVLERTANLHDLGPLVLEGGSYRLTVAGEGAATGTFRFTVHRFSDNSEPIALDTLVAGEINVPGLRRRYTFNTSQG